MVLAGFVGDFGWFWMVLGGFGSFWVVLGGFGWFRVLVTTVRVTAKKEFTLQADDQVEISTISCRSLPKMLLIKEMLFSKF